MTFSKSFRAITLLTAILAGFSLAAKNNSGKITYYLGDPQIMKADKPEWKSIRTSPKKVNKDDKIRTVLEEQVIVSFPDGSSITIDENSLVEIPELLSEDGVNKFAANIKSGRIHFDAQKQRNVKSTIKFTTGTAVAAIRGTSGVIGTTTNGKTYASLREGLLELTIGTKTYSVGAGQTALPGPDGNYQVVDLASSGETEFLKELEDYLNDTTVTLDSIIRLAKDKDSQYAEMLQSLKDSLQCATNILPDTIHENKITIKATCKPNITVTISDETFTSTGEEIVHETGWATSAEGDKKIPITCTLGKVSTSCGLLKTYYQPIVVDTVKKDTTPAHTKLELTTTEIDVCDKGLATVEGVFDPNDISATLRVSVGNKVSDNLLLLFTSGKFSYSVPVSDKEGNWNETKIKVEYESNAYGKEEASANLNVNKSCPDVNLTAPSVTFMSSDSVKCDANLKVEGAKGDIVLFTPYLDGSPLMDETFTNDGKTSVNLTKGLHDYNFTVQDQAGRKSSINRRLGCYPTKDHFSIDLKGGNYERLRVPPAPPKASSILYRNLHFSVSGMSENDPVFIKEITISQENKQDEIIKGASLQSNSVDYQVEVPWGTTVSVNIEVKMKNGAILTKTKTYDARSTNKSKTREVK